MQFSAWLGGPKNAWFILQIAKIESSRPRDTLQLGEQSELQGQPKEGPPGARTAAKATKTAFEPGSGKITVPVKAPISKRRTVRAQCVQLPPYHN